MLYWAIAFWAAERLFRVLLLMFRNLGNGGSKTLVSSDFGFGATSYVIAGEATYLKETFFFLIWTVADNKLLQVEALPGDACRVTIEMARPWTFRPGQHAYLYMPTVGLWASHPFSIAWSQEAEILNEDKLSMNRQDILAMKKTSMSFIIRARTGFTNKLYKKAEASPNGQFQTTCYAEGPYGGMHMMHSYGTVMMFAGGVGITHQVPHVRDLVAGYANGTVAARKIILVWVIQSPEHLEWIRPWMTSILAMDKRRDVLRIMLFVSRPKSTKEIHSPSATVQMFPGRPNIETLMDIEIDSRIGAMGVSVCGSGALSDDVRKAVRDRQHVATIDFIEEAFSVSHSVLAGVSVETNRYAVALNFNTVCFYGTLLTDYIVVMTLTSSE